MSRIVVVFERGKPFDYRAFAKHMVTCPNVMWSHHWCSRPKFRTAVEIELNVDKDTAIYIVQRLLDLGMLRTGNDDDVGVVSAIRG